MRHLGKVLLAIMLVGLLYIFVVWIFWLPH
jgi:hypothetical protein